MMLNEGIYKLISDHRNDKLASKGLQCWTDQ